MEKYSIANRPKQPFYHDNSFQTEQSQRTARNNSTLIGTDRKWLPGIKGEDKVLGLNNLKTNQEGRLSISPMRLSFHLYNGKIVNKFGAKIKEVPFSEMDFANQKIIKTRRKKLMK